MIVFLFLLAISGLAVPAQDLIEKSRELILAKQYREALQLLDRARQLRPEDSRTYFYAGLALTEAGHLREAVSELKTAIELDPDQPEYHLVYGEVLYKLGQNNMAVQTLKIFDQGENLERLSEKELWLLCDLFYRLEKLDEALSVLETFAAHTPDSPAVNLRRGELYLKKGDLDRALRAFQRYLEQEPRDHRGFHGLGTALFLKNQLREAKKAFLEALRLAPGSTPSLYQLGLVCLQGNETEEAIRYLEQAADPRFPRIYHSLGMAYRQAGNLEKAQQYLRQFQEIQSARQEQEEEQRRILLLMAEAQERMEKGDLEQARKLCQRALEIAPDHWLAHSYLAKSYLSSSRFWNLAYHHLVRMEEIDPSAFEGKYLMAQYWYRRSEHQKALSYAEEARELRPGYGELRNLLGNIYVSLGRPTEALAEYRAATQLAPERADFRANYEALSEKQPNR